MHVLHEERIGMQGVLFDVCACWVVLARVRGELPARSAGDAGMVPLTSRAAAKGGERGDSCYGHIGIF